jgi:hypothetical protein
MFIEEFECLIDCSVQFVALPTMTGTNEKLDASGSPGLGQGVG